MRISAQVQSGAGEHRTNVTTNGLTQSIELPPKIAGSGSRVNGGELLFLALATCYCNDICREAARRGIVVERVIVDVDGDFGAEGDPATGISYRAKVVAQANAAEIEELMRVTDTVAEIQNTLRQSTPVTLVSVEAVTASP